MLGKVDKQITFSDYWLQGRIPEDSYWSKIRKWANENLTDEMFQPLFSYYGRPSVSPVYTFTAMLIQLEKGYSDREMEEETRFDDRVKYGITAQRDFDGIDAVTLCDHRKRFFESEIGTKILLDTINQAKEAGLFDEENLHVIDSFMVWGSCAKQDTYTMIYQGIKMVLKVMSFYEMGDEGRKVLKRTDYNEKNKKPKINWEDSEEKAKLLEELVKDALALVSYAKEQKTIKEDLKDAVNLLEKIALQDVDVDKDGHITMKKGTAEDRIISVNDPDMRHGRKTSSKLSDGYKAEIITGGEKASIVIGIEVDGANVADGEHMSDLIDECKENGNEIDKLYGDSAYCDWEEIEKREKEGIEFCVKVPQVSNSSGGYTKEEFHVDVNNGKIICPNGCIKEFDSEKVKQRKGATVKFDAATCNQCPHKEQCTKSQNGRTMRINPYEDRIQEQREYQKTEAYKSDYSKRANGERTIAQLTRGGGRESRYIGKKKTKWQLIMASINNNLKVVMGFIATKLQDTAMGEVCPKVV
jgi:transposase